MKIEIYPCGYFKGVYCPYAGRNKNNFHCSQTTKNCADWRQKNFPEIKEKVERDIAITRSKLKTLPKIVLDLNLTKHL